MADGITHLTTNLVAGCVMSVAAVHYAPNEEVAVGVIIGSFLGTLLTPDLDINASSMPKRMVGVLKLRWYFYPYSKLIKHRSKYSHRIFISTLLRAFYIFPFLLLLQYVLGLDISVWIWIMVSWSIQDLTHLILDRHIW